MIRCLLSIILLTNLVSSAISQEYKLIKPRKGEGIYSLLRRNKVEVSTYIDSFIELNRAELGPSNSLKKGVRYKVDRSWIKAKEEWRKYAIFGSEYSNLKVLDHSLKGAIFYLVSGHGGPDPGAVGKISEGSLCEDEYAYDVTLRLARWLIERDALVYFITRDDNDGIRDGRYLPCDKDEYAYKKGAIPRNQLARLKQRTDIVNELYLKNKKKHQRMVVIHVDSRSTNENVDVFFYHHDSSSKGRELARDIYKTFESNYKIYQPNRDYRGSVKERSSLYVIKNSFPPAVFIELGNITNAKDQKRILLTDNRQALAKWIGEALLKNFQDR